MTSRLFVASLIEERTAKQEMDEAWHRLLDILPEDTPNVTRRPPYLTIRALGKHHEKDLNQTAAIKELDHRLHNIATSAEPIDLMLGYIHTSPGAAWISIGGTDEAVQQLDRLAEQVDHAVKSCLTDRGLDVEERSHDFFAHVTLGEFDPAATRVVANAVMDAAYPRQAPFRIGRLQITRSTQQGKGVTIFQPVGTAAQLGGRRPDEPGGGTARLDSAMSGSINH